LTPSKTGETIHPSLLPTSEILTVATVPSFDFSVRPELSTSTTVTIALSVNSSIYGGVIYCGAFDDLEAVRELFDVKSDSTSLSLSPAKGDYLLTLRELSPSQIYYLLCYSEDSLGNSGTVSESKSQSIEYVSPCCKQISVLASSEDSLSSLELYASMSEQTLSNYLQTLVLSHLPFEDWLRIEFEFYSDLSLTSPLEQVHATPNSFNITSGQIETKMNFFLYGDPGLFFMFLNVSGPSSKEYDLTPLVLLMRINDTTSSPIPKLSNAIYDYSGQTLTATFSATIDVINEPQFTSFIWNCSDLLEFTGAESAGCLWLSSSAIRVIRNHYEMSSKTLLPSQNMTLRSGILFVSCGSDCRISVPSSTVIISRPLEILKPTVVLLGPAQLTLCHNLTLDATLSTGNAGAPWKTMEWTVISADGSGVDELLTFLQSFSDTFELMVIPSSLLRETTYSISLGLRNILQSLSEPLAFKTIQIVVQSGASLDVSIQGSSQVSIQRSQSISRTAFASLTMCSAQGGVSQIIPSYNYQWSVRQNSGIFMTGTSSRDPRVFLANSNTFQTASTYTVVITVTASSSGTTLMKSSSFALNIIPSPLVALINQTKKGSLTYNTFSPLLLDGSMSYDPDSSSLLSYTWSCTLVSVSGSYGSNCLSVLGITNPNSATLRIAPLKLNSNNTYSFRLKISSTLFGRVRTSEATLDVQIQSNLIEVVQVITVVSSGTSLINPSNKIVIDGFISSNTGVTATWSYLSSESFSLPTSSLGPIEKSFSNTQSTNINFPLILPKNVFVGDRPHSFRLTALSPSGSSFHSTVTITPNGAPVGGTFVVNPPSGYAFFTSFTMLCSSWIDSVTDYPLSYQFFYQFSVVYDQDSNLNLIGDAGFALLKSTILPVGVSENFILNCIVKVNDIWGSETIRYLPIQSLLSESLVESQYSSNSQAASFQVAASGTNDPQFEAFILNSALPHQLSVATESGQNEDVASLLEALIEAAGLFDYLQRSNCSTSLHCVDLHRSPCSGTSHTCGPCLSGYTGVFGDSNYPCIIENSGATLLSPCSENSDCGTGYCSLEGKCSWPKKLCPVSKLDGSECSRQGTCEYFDYQLNVLVNPLDCTVDNPFCLPKCRCNSDRGGGDCSLTFKEAKGLDSTRGDFCSALDTLSTLLNDGVTKLDVLLDLLSLYFNSQEVASSTSTLSCGAILDRISAELSLLASDSSRDSSVYDHQVLTILDSMVQAKQPEVISSQISSLLSSFHEKVENSLVAGQYPYDLVSSNLRMRYYYERLSDLPGSTLYAPQTLSEVAYSAGSLTLHLPLNGLDFCGSPDQHAKIVLTAWGLNPFNLSVMGVNTPFFSTEVLATGGAPIVSPNDWYLLRLPLYESFNLSTETASCYELNVATNDFSFCEFCEIAQFDVDWVLFNCTDASSYLCPQSASFLTSLGHMSRRKLQESSSSYRVLQVEAIVIPQPRSSSSLTSQRSFPVFLAVAAWIILFLLIAFFIHLWDRADRHEFSSARYRTLQGNCFSFHLSSAFDEQGQRIPESQEEVPVAEALKPTAYVFPSTSFLSSDDWKGQFVRSLKRHHRWFRVVTFPSWQKSRFIRFTVVCVDVLLVLFATTTFYQLLFPDDNTCEKHNTSTGCLEESSFISDNTLCIWHSVSQSCEFNTPSLNLYFLALVALLVVAFTTPPRIFFQFLLEDYCSKRPQFGANSESLRELNENKDSSSEQEIGAIRAPKPYPYAYCDEMTADQEVSVLLTSTKEFFNATLEETIIPWRVVSTKQKNPRDMSTMGAMMRWMHLHPDSTPIPLSSLDRLRFGSPVRKIRWKLEYVRKKAAQVVDSRPSSEHPEFQSLVLLQTFILEQLSPSLRYAIQRDLFHMDCIEPGFISTFPWLLSWLVVILSLLFMSGWILLWAYTAGNDLKRIWGLTICVVIVADIVLNEPCRIFIVHGIIVQKLRPQLKQIYQVLHTLLYSGKRKKSHGEIRLVQHTSAACRAARASPLCHLEVAHLLQRIDDTDLSLCRYKRLSKLLDIGPLAYLFLWVPSKLKDWPDIFRQVSLDLFLPAFWCTFLLANYYLYQIHLAALGGLYVLIILLWIFFFFVAPSPAFKASLSSPEDVYDKKLTNKFRLKGDEFATRPDTENTHWQQMNEVGHSSEISGFQFNDLEFSPDFAMESTDGLFEQFPALTTTYTPHSRSSQQQLHAHETFDEDILSNEMFPQEQVLSLEDLYTPAEQSESLSLSLTTDLPRESSLTEHHWDNDSRGPSFQSFRSPSLTGNSRALRTSSSREKRFSGGDERI
jgi:hypothetical protein